MSIVETITGAVTGAVQNPLQSSTQQNPLIVGNKVLSTQSIQCINYETTFYAETMLMHKDEFTDVLDNIFFKKLLSEYIPPSNTTDIPPKIIQAQYALKYKEPIIKTPQKKYEEIFITDNDDDFTGEIDTSTGAISPGIIQFTSIKDNTLLNNNIVEDKISQRLILINLYKAIFKSSIINLWKTQTDTLFILPCFNIPDNGIKKLNTNLKGEIKDLYTNLFTKEDTSFFKDVSFNKTIPPDDQILKSELPKDIIEKKKNYKPNNVYTCITR